MRSFVGLYGAASRSQQRVFLLAALLALGALFLGMQSRAVAGGLPPSTYVGPITQLFDSMRSAVHAWQVSGQEAARRIFGVLAAINILWVGIELLTAGGTDAKSGIGRLARELFVLGFFYSMIDRGPAVATEILEFFESSGQQAGGATESIQVVLDDTIKVSVKLVQEGGGSLFGLESVWLALCAIAIVALAGLVGAVMLVVEFVAYFAIGVGAIVLGGGGAVWTRYLVSAYLKFAGSAALALYCLRFSQNFVVQSLKAWAAHAQSPGSYSLPSGLGGQTVQAQNMVLGPEMLLTMLVTVCIEAVLVLAVPAVAVALSSGGVSSIADYAGTRMASATARSGMAGLANAAVDGAKQAYGAARSAVSSAFSGSGSGASLLASSGGPTPKVSDASAGSTKPSGARPQGGGSASVAGGANVEAGVSAGGGSGVSAGAELGAAGGSARGDTAAAGAPAGSLSVEGGEGGGAAAQQEAYAPDHAEGRAASSHAARGVGGRAQSLGGGAGLGGAGGASAASEAQQQDSRASSGVPVSWVAPGAQGSPGSAPSRGPTDGRMGTSTAASAVSRDDASGRSRGAVSETRVSTASAGGESAGGGGGSSPARDAGGGSSSSIASRDGAVQRPQPSSASSARSGASSPSAASPSGASPRASASSSSGLAASAPQTASAVAGGAASVGARAASGTGADAGGRATAARSAASAPRSPAPRVDAAPEPKNVRGAKGAGHGQ